MKSDFSMVVCGRILSSKSFSINFIDKSVEMEPKQFSMSNDANLWPRSTRLLRTALNACLEFLIVNFGLLYALDRIDVISFDVLYATVLIVDVTKRSG